MKKNALLKYLLFLFVLPVCAQNVKDDMRKINAFYEKHTSLSMDLEYSLYLDNNLNRVYEKENGEYKRKGENKYIKEMGAVTIMNKNYVTIADHEEKVIMIGKNNNKKNNSLSKIPFDSLFTVYKQIKTIAATATSKGYSFIFENGEYTYVDLVFNNKTFAIEKITLHYRDKIEISEDEKEHSAIMEIRYSNVQVNPRFQSSDFSETQFVQRSKGKASLNPKYKHYSFINHLQS